MGSFGWRGWGWVYGAFFWVGGVRWDIILVGWGCLRKYFGWVGVFEKIFWLGGGE